MQKSGALQALVSRRPDRCVRTAPRRAPPPTWRETPSTSSDFAQETRHPHEMDTGKKSLATCDSALLEVLDAALNQRLELVARGELRDVLVEPRTGALRVTHLAQDATIGAGNALDS